MIEQDTSAACIGIAGPKLSPIRLQETDTGAEVDLAGDCGMIRTVFGQTGWRDLVKNRDGWMKTGKALAPVVGHKKVKKV